MAQTERSFSILESLLADNNSGDISPQDLRDAFASQMGYGCMVVTVSAGDPTMTSVGVSPVLIDVFDLITAESSDVNTGGIVATLSPTYDLEVVSTGIYNISFWASFSSSAGNKVITFTPHLNGSAGLIEVNRDVAANDTGVAAFNGIISYTAGQKIDMRVHVDSGTSDLTFHSAAFTIHRVG